jgi:hypothetical protein
MALVRLGDTDYNAIYKKWFNEGEAGWVNYAGLVYAQRVDFAGVVAFDSFNTISLLDSRSLSDSKAATYSKLDDGGHDV